MANRLHVFILFISLISFMLFFVAEAATARKNSRNLMDVLQKSGKIWVLLYKYITGIFILSAGVIFSLLSGAISASLVWPNQYHFNIIGLTVWVIILFLTAFISFKTAKKDLKDSQTLSSVKCLSKTQVNQFIAIRIVFLVVYECFFRGLLLFFIISIAGIYIAITINVILYILIHFFSNKKEIFGTIPFGVILCISCFLNKLVWPAITIHLTLALTYEISLLRLLANANHKFKSL